MRYVVSKEVFAAWSHHMTGCDKKRFCNTEISFCVGECVLTSRVTFAYAGMNSLFIALRYERNCFTMCYNKE